MASKLLMTEIKRHRKLNGISQSHVAKVLKMPLSTYALKEREGSFKRAELVTIEKALKLKDETLIKAAAIPVVTLNYDELMLTAVAANKVMLRAFARLVAAAEGKSERVTLHHFFEELSLEKKELAKEFSTAELRKRNDR